MITVKATKQTRLAFRFLSLKLGRARREQRRKKKNDSGGGGSGGCSLRRFLALILRSIAASA
jgi:hypothetical protein